MARVFKIKFEDTLRRLSVPMSYDESAAGLTFDELKGKIYELFRISPISQLVITYTDAENDVVTMVDDQDLIDACVVQRLNPLRLEVKVVEGGTQSVEVDDKETSAGPSAEPLEPEPVAEFSVEALLKGVFPQATADSIRQILSRYPPFLEAAVPAGLLPDALEAFLKTLTGAAAQGGRQAAPVSSESATFDPFKQPFDCQQRSEQSGPQAYVCPRGKGSKGDASAGIFHKGVQCDGCGMTPIEGPRYKSMKEHNYDLCSSCFIEIGNETDYQKLDRPMQFRRNHWHHRPMREPMGAPPFRPFFSRGPYGWRPEHPSRSNLVNANAAGEHAGGKLDARFVQDVTIFDGTELAPGTKFTKIWRLRNVGTLPWPQRTQLVHIGGDVLSSDEAISLQLPEGGLSSGQEIEASVDLVAPESAGRHVSYWRLMSPSGQRFGHRVWVLIQVVPKGEQSPQMQESISEEEKVKAKKKSILASSVIGTDRTVAVEDFLLKASSTDEVVETSEAAEDSLLNVAYNDETVETTEATSFHAARQVVEPDVQQAEKTAVDVSEMVNSELGGFSIVEKPVENMSGNSSAINGQNLINMEPTFEESLVNIQDFVPELQAGSASPGSSANIRADLHAILQETVLEKLESMGFTERDLNIELLEKNKNNLQHTIDDLVTVAGWDHMLKDLQEMGFSDTQTNRRLLFKNEGSIKRVVKELVEMEKQRVELV